MHAYVNCTCAQSSARLQQFFRKSSAAYPAYPTTDLSSKLWPVKFFQDACEVSCMVECKKTIHDASIVSVEAIITRASKQGCIIPSKGLPVRNENAL